MKINWLIDKYLFDEYEPRLVDAIVKSGCKVHFYDDICGLPFKEYVQKKFNQDEIYIFHGSLQHGRQISHLPIYPGVFMTIENYECYNYYGYFGEHLLNSNYLMMGLNDVVRNAPFIIKSLEERNYVTMEDMARKVFIRPSNGYKSFAGQMVNMFKIKNDIDLLSKSYGGVEPNTLVVLAKEQKLLEEHRFIVIDGEVISGSMYFDKSNIGTFKPYYDKITTDQDVIDFAVKMSKIYQPDKAYTIDICKTQSGECKLLELNSFNCASMYGNDYEKVVKATNELAIKEYNDLFID